MLYTVTGKWRDICCWYATHRFQVRLEDYDEFARQIKKNLINLLRMKTTRRPSSKNLRLLLEHMKLINEFLDKLDKDYRKKRKVVP